MHFTLQGLVVPVFTPFHENGDLNLELIDDYANYLLDTKSLDGILVNGTTGEGMSMSTTERKAVAAAWIQAVRGRTHVMIQVGGAPLPDVIELAKDAELLGANSILCLPDLYVKPKTNEELADYLRVVSQAAANTPLLYYHIPMFTNVTIDMGSFLRFLSSTSDYPNIPTFVGIKFTSNDLDEAFRVSRTKYSIFLGADTLMLPAAIMGISSAIATTLNFSAVTAKEIMSSQVGMSDRAKVQAALNELVAKITQFGDWVPSMKVAMNAFNPDLDCGPVRPPMVTLCPDDQNELLSKLL